MTTIVSVRRGDSVALGGDGQVTLGNIVIKGTARKVRRLGSNKMLTKHIDRFPLLKLDQVIDWQPIEQYLNRQRSREIGRASCRERV